MKHLSPRIKKILFVFLLPIVLTVLIGTMAWFHILSSWHLKLSTFLFSTNTEHSGDVTIVKIDDKSLLPVEQGGVGRWQDWKRAYYAEAINNLEAAGAKVIGLDIFFSETTAAGTKSLLDALDKKLPDIGQKRLETIKEEIAHADDLALKEVLEKNSNIILATKAGIGSQAAIVPHELFQTKNTLMAPVNLQEDEDNILRTIPLIFNGHDSFALSLVRNFLNLPPAQIFSSENPLVLSSTSIKNVANGKNYGPLQVPITPEQTMLIHFQSAPYSTPSLSFVDVLQNKFDPAVVRNKIVLLGEMGSGLHDELYVPVSHGVQMPGVEIHANAIETLLSGNFLREMNFSELLILTFLISFLIAVGMIFMRPLIMTLLWILSLLGYSVGAILVFQKWNYIPNMWYPYVTLSLTYIGVLLYKYVIEAREKKKVTSALSLYVSDKLVRKIMENPAGLQLGGEKKILTVLFTDVAGFTSLSEKMSPEQLVEFMNAYLDRMSGIILKYDGTLDKYIGDAIMAFWGAPVANKKHASSACKSALLMHKALQSFLLDWKHVPEVQQLRIRTGIATGEMVVGNMGSRKRFDYTVIGDNVNLASRLEGVNKNYQSEICVSKSTYDATEHEFTYRILDKIRVKGKKQPVEIYELLETKDLATMELLHKIQLCEEGYGLYQDKQFKKALKVFQEGQKQFADDPYFTLYIDRCENFIKEPPKAWDGVYEMTTK